MIVLNPKHVSYFAKTNFRREGNISGIYQKDRLHHFYILRKTGTGKTTLLHTKIMQDVIQNRVLAVLDIHVDLITKVILDIPKRKTIGCGVFRRNQSLPKKTKTSYTSINNQAT